MRRKLYYIGVYFALIIGITGCGIAQAQGNIDVTEKNETTITKTEIEEIKTSNEIQSEEIVWDTEFTTRDLEVDRKSTRLNSSHDN